VAHFADGILAAFAPKHARSPCDDALALDTALYPTRLDERRRADAHIAAQRPRIHRRSRSQFRAVPCLGDCLLRRRHSRPAGRRGVRSDPRPRVRLRERRLECRARLGALGRSIDSASHGEWASTLRRERRHRDHWLGHPQRLAGGFTRYVSASIRVGLVRARATPR
jgi:hypothetical protein